MMEKELSKEALKEAIEILTPEMNTSLHFSKYPQDRWKDEQADISKLITTSEYHSQRWQNLQGVINHLISLSEIKSDCTDFVIEDCR